MLVLFFFFFFQAEDGIRDYKVTGVQTCALPICPPGDGVDRRAGVGAGIGYALRVRDRKSVVYGKSVDLGGRRIIKKKKKIRKLLFKYPRQTDNQTNASLFSPTIS